LLYRAWKVYGEKVSFSPVLLFLGLAAILMMHPLKGYEVAFDTFVSLAVFPVMVFLGACSKTQGWTSRVLLTLGSMSYAIYFIQFQIFSACAFLGSSALGHLPFDARYVLAIASIALVVAIAFASDRYFDRPARRALTRLLS